MLGNSVINSAKASPSSNRVFIYEVTGLKQSDENDNNRYPFRTSSNVFIKVPYSRMNEQMRRIGLMGGTIVNISSFDSSQTVEDSDD